MDELRACELGWPYDEWRRLRLGHGLRLRTSREPFFIFVEGHNLHAFSLDLCQLLHRRRLPQIRRLRNRREDIHPFYGRCLCAHVRRADVQRSGPALGIVAPWLRLHRDAAHPICVLQVGRADQGSESARELVIVSFFSHLIISGAILSSRS